MGGCAVAKGGSGVAAGLGKLVGVSAAGGGWAAATALLGGAANAAAGVAAVPWKPFAHGPWPNPW